MAPSYIDNDFISGSHLNTSPSVNIDYVVPAHSLMIRLKRPSRVICQAAVQTRRRLATVASRHYDALVVGAGPGGLTCASNLLDQGLSKICIVDPAFTGGRIHEKYREVPSNTKAGLFTQWATGTNTFAEIIESTQKPNAFEKLKSLDPSQGCQLGDAMDVALLLSDGLRSDPRVDTAVGRVQRLARKGDVWTMPGDDGLTSDRVVLAQGSHPRRHDLINQYPHLQALDLDTCLKPSLLKTIIPPKSKVGVIGASHSAILALKNLFELGDISIVNFHRSPLLYAIYKDGWILYDNTGLKGIAADWARDTLDGGSLPPNLIRINLKDDSRTEKEIYDAELNDCTHLMSAVGFELNAQPQIDVDGAAAQPEFDPLTGRFFRARNDTNHLPGLFGAGIAYPERVTDKAGNVESAVGWFKFMKFAKRVVPEWAK